MNAIIRRMTEADAEDYVALRVQMLVDTPLAFGASPEDDSGSKLEVSRGRLGGGPASALFGAYAPNLVGAVGIFRSDKLKARHILSIWGMYVTPSHRGRGLARELMEAMIAHCRTIEGVVQVQLTVSESSPAAHALYESLGFKLWGTEPRAMFYEGEYVDEHYLTLLL